jgi:hypothetical protein
MFRQLVGKIDLYGCHRVFLIVSLANVLQHPRHTLQDSLFNFYGMIRRWFCCCPTKQQISPLALLGRNDKV